MFCFSFPSPVSCSFFFSHAFATRISHVQYCFILLSRLLLGITTNREGNIGRTIFLGLGPQLLLAHLALQILTIFTALPRTLSNSFMSSLCRGTQPLLSVLEAMAPHPQDNCVSGAYLATCNPVGDLRTSLPTLTQLLGAMMAAPACAQSCQM